MIRRSLLIVYGMFISSYALSDDIQSVDTTHIRASKELPKVLYVVPWKDVNSRDDSEQKLVLHNFFGDLYEPILPDEMNLSFEKTSSNNDKK